MATSSRNSRCRGAALALAASVAILLWAQGARAEFKVRSPIVDYREFEFEHNGDVTFDKPNSGLNNGQSYTNEIEYGVLPWWQPGIEGEWGADPGGNLTYQATTFENLFQITPQGEYWADLGFFAEYSHAASRADADEITFGPLIQKETPDLLGLDLLHTANLLISKQVGHDRNDATPVLFAWQTRWRLDPHFEPGLEYYGQFNPIESAATVGDPQHRFGPVLVGLVNFYRYGKIKYELGYLFGLNRATEQGAVRWRLEYEKPF